MENKNSIDKNLLQSINAYVDAHYTQKSDNFSFFDKHLDFGNRKELRGLSSPSYGTTNTDLLASLLNLSEKTFSETLLRLMEKRGIKPAELYKKTGLTKAHFSKIKLRRDYQPSKETALALAIALQLTLDETADFLKRAGYSLSRSQKRDLVVEYFIKEGIYDNDKVNISLYELGLQPLSNHRRTQSDE